MGKIITVGSVVYNLAGDEDKRPDYLKTVVVGNVISNTNFSMADSINSAYLKGPGIKLRSFTRWAARSGYNAIMGYTYGQINVGDSINMDVLAEQMPHDPDETVDIQTAKITRNDTSYEAEAYILANHPELWATDWASDYLADTDSIRILYEDGHTEVFAAPDYDPLAKYLHVRYVRTKPGTPGPLIEGDPVVLGSADPFPSVTGWTMVHDTVSTPTEVDLQQTTETRKVYSDGRPDEVTTDVVDSTQTYGKIEGEFTKTVYNGMLPDGSATTETVSTQYQTRLGTIEEETDVSVGDEVDEGDDVTSVTTITTTTQTLKVVKQYQINKQTNTLKTWAPMQLLNYKFESGNPSLDLQFGVPTDMGAFFPYIPFRINNLPVLPIVPQVAALYPWAKKAFKKATGANKYDSTLIKIAENEDIGDIDYVYASFGVSLNVKEDACKKYIYKFFQMCLESQFDSGAYAIWKDAMDTAKAAADAWKAWKEAQEDEENPLYGTQEPEQKPFPNLPQFYVQVASGGLPPMNYNMMVLWSAMAENVGVGQKWPGAKAGQFMWDALSEEVFPTMVYNSGQFLDENVKVPRVILHWQVTDNSWRSMAIWGLGHRNYVWKGKTVEISALDALLDTDESGFIIPLHDGLFREMSLIDTTQMSTACCFLVFNCYEEKKKKWYQTGLFQVIVIIVIIIVAIYTGGAGAGLLGTAAEVGASLGFTGLAAIVVGAVANALAAMILMQVIQMGAVALFGEKVGAIVGVIAGMIALNIGTSISNGGTAMSGFADLMSADNILKLTEAAGKGWAEYIQAGAKKTVEAAADYAKEGEEQSRQYDQLYADNIGYGHGIIDPTQFTDAAKSLGFTPESLDSFMARTLMTGTEVAELSQTLITNFSNITLSLDLPK